MASGTTKGWTTSSSIARHGSMPAVPFAGAARRRASQLLLPSRRLNVGPVLGHYGIGFYRALDLRSGNWRPSIANSDNDNDDMVFARRDSTGLDNELIVGALGTGTGGRVRRRPRLSGLLNYYDRAA